MRTIVILLKLGNTTERREIHNVISTITTNNGLMYQVRTANKNLYLFPISNIFEIVEKEEEVASIEIPVGKHE